MPRAVSRPEKIAGDKCLDAIFTLVEAMQPDPRVLVERMGDYLDARAQRDAAAEAAAVVNDWARRRIYWQSRMGKLLTATQIADLSPSMKSEAAVHKARRNGRLLAIDVGTRAYFPELQFGPDGGPKPWVRPLATALPDSDTVLQFLGAGRGALKGRSFAEILRTARPPPSLIESMLSGARALALAETR